MNAGKSLLIELGTEELPPKALDELSAAFLLGICDGLGKRGVSAGLDQAVAYASPRRLAAFIPDVASSQPEQAIERRGPALAAAFDAEGQPSKALLGFAQSCGVEVGQLEKLETDKGAWFVWRTVKAGQALAALLPEVVDEALQALPIPRPPRPSLGPARPPPRLRWATCTPSSPPWRRRPARRSATASRICPAGPPSTPSRAS